MEIISYQLLEYCNYLKATPHEGNGTALRMPHEKAQQNSSIGSGRAGRYLSILATSRILSTSQSFMVCVEAGCCRILGWDHRCITSGHNPLELNNQFVCRLSLSLLALVHEGWLCRMYADYLPRGHCLN